MRVEWNERKASANVNKHGVTFEEGVTALMDAAAVTFFDEIAGAEEREITIGHSARNRLLVVVHTERTGSVVRIISVRRATKKECRTYEEGI
jgi:hypothetical protein